MLDILLKLAALCLTAFGMYLGRKYQLLQVQEAESRNRVTVNVEISIRILTPKGISNSNKILETLVEVKNVSKTTLCIPQVYVSARALFETNNPVPYENETDFENLIEIEKLSKIKNIAYYEGSITKISPDEIERFVRWDTVTPDFVQKHPIIVVGVEVFGFKEDHYNKEKQAWDEFLRNKNIEGFNYIIYTRYNPDKYNNIMSINKIKYADRCLLKIDSPVSNEFESDSNRYSVSIDEENTLKFKKILDDVVQWTRLQTVNLSD